MSLLRHVSRVEWTQSGAAAREEVCHYRRPAMMAQMQRAAEDYSRHELQRQDGLGSVAGG